MTCLWGHLFFFLLGPVCCWFTLLNSSVQSMYYLALDLFRFFKWFLFVALLILFMHSFPNFFSCLWFLVVHWISLRGLLSILCQTVINFHLFRVHFSNFRSLLWWYNIYLILRDPCIVLLVSANLKKHSSTLAFLGKWVQPMTCFPAQVGHMICSTAVPCLWAGFLV